MHKQETWSLHRQPKDCMGGDAYEYSIWQGERIVLMADIAPNPLNSVKTIEDMVAICNSPDRLVKALEGIERRCREVINGAREHAGVITLDPVIDIRFDAADVLASLKEAGK